MEVSSAPTAPPPGDQKTTKPTLQGLPLEIQRSIFKHSSSSNLIALALVSKHFHALACAQLYRTFSIVFPDDDDPAFESPIDGLAGGLDAMVTSKHEHAKHLKEIVLDSLSGGQEGERAYRHYSLDVSCGKFLNTLLALCMRRAKALESFHWNIRVELSRPVLKALQEIPNLRNLHIRLQNGPSLYQLPPPLPSQSSETSSLLSSSAATLAVPFPPLKKNLRSPYAPSDLRNSVAGASSFAGFKSLSSLAVLDMDTLEYLPELASCIEASSSSLKKLKLSISEKMARAARRPIIEDSDDSDQEVDEFGNAVNPPLSPSPMDGTPESAQDKEARIRVVRAAQEQILGKVFQIDKPLSEQKKDNDKTDDKATHEKPFSEHEARAAEKFIEILTRTTKTLLEATSDVNSRQPKFRKDALEALKTIGKSAKHLMLATSSSEKNLLELEKGQPAESQAESQTEPKTSADEVTVAVPPVTNGLDFQKSIEGDAGLPSPDVAKEKPKEDVEELFKEVIPVARGVKSEPNAKGLEEIDIDHPDVVDEDAEEEDVVATFSKAVEQLQLADEKPDEFGSNKAASTVTMSGGLSQLDEAAASGNPITNQDASEDSLLPKSPEKTQKNASTDGDGSKAIRDYVRSTRKLCLRSLSIYLIPIKCSVVSQAIDLASLSRITLLNVGSQNAFWSFMSTTHKFTPLKLRSIFTDNVSASFLSLVSNLDSLKELFMLERGGRARVEPTAPRTSVTIDDIRKQILKKHLKGLKRLMIKNEADYSWDLDVRTIRLLTKRGDELQELAASIGLQNFHLLLQYLPGLTALQALHIVNFRIEDTCPTVKRDLLRFVGDVVAQHPDMKLGHIALDSDVHHLLRKKGKDLPDKHRPKKGVHGSGMGLGSNPLGASFPPSMGLIPSKPIDSWDDSTDSDGTSENDAGGRKRTHLPVVALENIKFYDTWGIRIFRKDVRAGSL